MTSEMVINRILAPANSFLCHDDVTRSRTPSLYISAIRVSVHPMAELRQTAFDDRWVILSAARGDRPDDFKTAPNKSDAQAAQNSSSSNNCPFCRNHEQETGAETFAFREGNVVGAPDWSVRVVYNKFPAVSSSLPLSSTTDQVGRTRMDGFGSHEVVVETPEHGVAFAALPIVQVERVLKSFRHRLRCLRDDKRIKYVQVFKNNGKEAGASLRHAHSQIIALPIVPQGVSCQLSSSKEHFDKTGKCLLCESVQADMQELTRLIDRSISSFISVAPFAPRFPFETWIVPLKHASNFEETSDSELEDLARLLQLTVKKLAQELNDVPYNYFLYTSPFNQAEDHSESFHWYICIVPRLVSLAGFELATGCNINIVSPEKTAQVLRDCPLS